MGVWVQLISAQHIDTDGRQKTYYPGDWVEVGRQTALRWVASGTARAPAGLSLELPTDCGVVLRRDDPAVRARLRVAGKLAVGVGDGPSHGRTLLLTPPASVPLHLLAVGFAYLERWGAVVPMCAGYPVAEDLAASAEDKERTRVVIRDLRVPLYDTRVLYLRNEGEGIALFDEWVKERADGGDERLAFLRALYAVKPRYLALPPEWVREK